MRRPLCLVCVAFVVSVFISLQMVPLPESANVEEGSRVIYTGQVYHKEYRYHSLILYLRNVNQVSSTKISTSDVKSKSVEKEKVSKGNKKESVFEAENISIGKHRIEESLQDMGILCYVE